MADLLTMLAAADEPDVIHALMPNMALACGRDVLEMYAIGHEKGRRMTTLTMARADCPECIAAAGGDLAGWCRELMGHQAEVEPAAG